MLIEPDTKDWTWVLQRPCPDCGFDAPGLDLGRLPQAIRDNANVWEVVLGTDDAAVRPQGNVWSPLEYACHVRDVNRLFLHRLHLMLSEDNPTFDNWDQDGTAVEENYLDQDPATVAAEVVAAADAVAAAYEQVGDDQWSRRGQRSDGSEFTIDSFARYHLHDLVHHAHDVSHVTKRVTVDSYGAHADDYRDATTELSESSISAIARLVELVGPQARVLEIGSGPGRDALALEAAGLSVRRTDITPAFVQMLRAQGLQADVVDPLHDDLSDPVREEPYDAVWASASLLHVRREDLPEALARLAAATRPGGSLMMAVKEGDGARFSTHGSIGAPRHFTFWREPGLREVVAGAGWQVTEIKRWDGRRGETWLEVEATRA